VIFLECRKNLRSLTHQIFPDVSPTIWGFHFCSLVEISGSIISCAPAATRNISDVSNLSVLWLIAFYFRNTTSNWNLPIKLINQTLLPVGVHEGLHLLTSLWMLHLIDYEKSSIAFLSLGGGFLWLPFVLTFGTCLEELWLLWWLLDDYGLGLGLQLAATVICPIRDNLRERMRLEAERGYCRGWSLKEGVRSRLRMWVVHGARGLDLVMLFTTRAHWGLRWRQVEVELTLRSYRVCLSSSDIALNVIQIMIHFL
jgi:hypothetical protein